MTLGRLKQRLANWLLRGVTLEELRIRSLRVGRATITIGTNIEMGGGSIKNMGRPADDKDALRLADFLDDFFYLQTHFESLDRFEYTAGVSITDRGLQLSTGTTANTVRKVSLSGGLGDGSGFPQILDWGKKHIWWARVEFNSHTNQEIWIMRGDPDRIGSYRHIGFKMINGDLYGTTGDGSSESTCLLASYSSSPIRLTLKYVYTPNVEARFYVNGSDKGAITASLPSGFYRTAIPIGIYVKNTAAEDKVVRVSLFKFLCWP